MKCLEMLRHLWHSRDNKPAVVARKDLYYSEQDKPVESVSETVGCKIIYYWDGSSAIINVPPTPEQQAQAMQDEQAYREECEAQEDWIDE